MTQTKNLNGYANQFVIETDTTVVFQSYNSRIAEYNKLFANEHLKVFSDWDYSKTTMRHFKRFINEETSFSYVDSKQWRKEMKENPRIEEVL